MLHQKKSGYFSGTDLLKALFNRPGCLSMVRVAVNTCLPWWGRQLLRWASMRVLQGNTKGAFMPPCNLSSLSVNWTYWLVSNALNVTEVNGMLLPRLHCKKTMVFQNLEAAKMPFSSDWINKLWYIHTMEEYLVLKRSELSIHKKTWRKLKCILLSGKPICKGYIL